MSSKQAQDVAGLRYFLNELLELKVEDVKMKLSCETSLKNWKWKMWKWSFRARLHSKTERGRCENEAFVRDFTQKLNVEDVKMKLSSVLVVVTVLGDSGGCDVIVVVVLVVATVPWRKWLSEKVSGSVSSLAGKPSEYNGIYREYEHGLSRPEKR